MKDDIPFLPVENVMVSVVRKPIDENEYEWFVYIINRNNKPISTVIVTSKGYGKKDGEEQSTSILRHVIPEIDTGSYGLIEPIQPDVFHLNNEYWVSYYIDAQIYDKKFIFVPDTIKEENLIEIKELGMQGVLHS